MRRGSSADFCGPTVLSSPKRDIHPLLTSRGVASTTGAAAPLLTKLDEYLWLAVRRKQQRQGRWQQMIKQLAKFSSSQARWYSRN